jgi:hypothetical protein
MCVRIDETGEDDFARTVDLGDSLAILLQPGIAQGVFGRANRNDLPAEAQDSAIFDDAELFEIGTTARSGLTRSRLQRKQLANIGQQQRRLHSLICFSG